MPDFVDDQDDVQEQQPTDAGKSGADKADAITLTRKEYDALQGRITELQTSERFWAGKAAAVAEKPAPKTEEPEANFDETDLTPDQIVDLIASKGKQGLKEAGFVSKKDLQAYLEGVERKVERRVAERVAAERERYNADASVMEEFPELKNAEFVQAVAKELEDVPADLRKSHAAIRLAARAVKASMKPAAPSREQQIAAQAGAGAGGWAGDDDDSETLSPLQRQLLASFNREGKAISEEQFVNRMKKGVRMSARAAFNPGSQNGYREPDKKRDVMEIDW